MIEGHLSRYNFSDSELIPLHRWNDQSTNRKGQKRLDGKRPKDSNWTKRDYDSKKVLRECLKEGRNVGYRCKPTDLVIDVDPRNGGLEGFKSLCEDLLIDAKQWTLVTGDTGSGGFHVYLRKPADIPVRDTLPDYPGVEFKSVGRQVVAMGSRHPNGNHYKWRTASKPFRKISAPTGLLNLIARPQSNAMTSGGQISPDELAQRLEAIDPCEFDGNEKWEPFMMACHHATAGVGRQEFIDWSTSDPKYADDAEIIGRRWDSCDEQKEGPARTYRTLNRVLKNLGRDDLLIKRDDAAEDFDEQDAAHPKPLSPKEELFGDDATADETPDEKSFLEQINAECSCVLVGGKMRVVRKITDDVLGRSFWTYMNTSDFRAWYGNKTVMIGEKSRKLGDAWLEWDSRKDYEGVVFEPNKEVPRKLNLWVGWTLEARKTGSWNRLNEMIQEAICDGDPEIYKYLMNWIRYLFQFPGRRAESAVVMQGGKGVGKSTLGNVLNTIIGRHSLAVASPELITGRFNSHLQDCIFLFADEAIRAHEKAQESRLKNLITEPTISFEAKGLDVVTGRNLLHVMMATNEDWAVPASIDERRFFVTKVNTTWQNKKAKWDRLYEELEKNDNSGYRRFLWDMLNPELDKAWHPREIPATAQLAEQKLRSLSPMGQWLYNIAESTRYPFPLLERSGSPNSKRRCRAFYNDVRDSFVNFCLEAGIRPSNMGRGNTRFFLQELQALLPDAKVSQRDRVPEDRHDIVGAASDGCAASIDFPHINDLRQSFESTLGQRIKWTLAQPISDGYDFG